MLKLHLLIPALALALAPLATAQTVETMPNPLPTSFSSNKFPFGSTSANSEHCQFIYGSASTVGGFYFVAHKFQSIPPDGRRFDESGSPRIGIVPATSARPSWT